MRVEKMHSRTNQLLSIHRTFVPLIFTLKISKSEDTSERCIRDPFPHNCTQNETVRRPVLDNAALAAIFQSQTEALNPPSSYNAKEELETTGLAQSIPAQSQA